MSFTPFTAIRVLLVACTEMWLETVMSLVMMITFEPEALRAFSSSEAEVTSVGVAEPPPVAPAA
jgi:hypothetical protein